MLNSMTPVIFLNHHIWVSNGKQKTQARYLQDRNDCAVSCHRFQASEDAKIFLSSLKLYFFSDNLAF